MGRRWRQYAVGGYRLGSLHNPKLGLDEAVVLWRDEDGPHRRRLGVFSEAEGRVEVDRFVGRLQSLRDRPKITVGELFKAYVAERQKDEKLVAAFWHNWKALEPRF